MNPSVTESAVLRILYAGLHESEVAQGTGSDTWRRVM